ncbi:MAG TPA: acetamidase/formamidase family protein [Jatrophihabitans sp.]|nr:acetamidase/formamidase family protein [Jatrophihabitans sp.]
MRLSRAQVHTAWDSSLPPIARVAGGEVVTVEVANSSGGQLDRRSTAADLATLDFGRVNPVTGPIAVEGAEPGDALVIDVLDVEVADWGWTANIPGFGLLAQDFPDAHLRLSAVRDGRVDFLPGLTLPAVPMIGTIGLAPAGPEVLPMVPPHRAGGNMDIRHVTAGTRLRLPVQVPGGLLSIGDTHAAMGDGEVCGTGVEIGSVVTVRLGVDKGNSIPTAILETDGRASRAGRSLIATGIGPDLWQAARDATRSLVEQLVRRTGLAPVDAYLLASVTADLHISEIVDLPNVVVSMHFPLDALDG